MTAMPVFLIMNNRKNILRLKGGAGGDPNNDSKFNEIPYLSKMNFMWNGLPCLDFDEKILNMNRQQNFEELP